MSIKANLYKGADIRGTHFEQFFKVCGFLLVKFFSSRTQRWCLLPKTLIGETLMGYVQKKLEAPRQNAGEICKCTTGTKYERHFQKNNEISKTGVCSYCSWRSESTVFWRFMSSDFSISSSFLTAPACLLLSHPIVHPSRHSYVMCSTLP